MIYRPNVEANIISAVLNGAVPSSLGLSPAHFVNPNAANVFATALRLESEGNRTMDLTLFDAVSEEYESAAPVKYLNEQCHFPRRCIPADMGQAQAEILLSMIAEEKRARINLDMAVMLQEGCTPKKAYQEAIERLQQIAEAPEAVPKLSSHMAGIMEHIKTGTQDPTMIRTGYAAIDDLSVGLIGGDLAILAARPSIGKTALAIGMMVKMMRSGSKVCFHSCEQSARSVANRILANVSMSCTKAVLRNIGSISQSKKNSLIESASESLSVADRMFIFDNGSPTLQDIEKRTEAAVNAGARCVFIDYLQLMRYDGENENQGITRNAEGVKAIAKNLNVPFVVLSQLSRTCEREKRPPKDSDLRGSGGIEQAADFIWFIHCRPDHERASGPKTFIQAKGRDVGVGHRTLHFQAETATFFDQEGF